MSPSGGVQDDEYNRNNKYATTAQRSNTPEDGNRSLSETSSPKPTYFNTVVQRPKWSIYRSPIFRCNKKNLIFEIF